MYNLSLIEKVERWEMGINENALFFPANKNVGCVALFLEQYTIYKVDKIVCWI